MTTVFWIAIGVVLTCTATLLGGYVKVDEIRVEVED